MMAPSIHSNDHIDFSGDLQIPDRPFLLGLACSPRMNGNSARLLSSFVYGVEDSGVCTKILLIPNLLFQGCFGCRECEKSGICKLKDDYTQCESLIRAASAIAVATPVYFSGVPGQAKMFIDRAQAAWVQKYILNKNVEASKEGVLMVVGGTGGSQTFLGVELTLKYWFAVFGIELIGKILAKNIDAIGSIESHSTFLKEAEDLGRLLAQKLIAKIGAEDQRR